MKIGPQIRVASTATLQLDYLSSHDIVAQPFSWWHNVLGVVGFDKCPLIADLRVPVAGSMTPTLGARDPLFEVWRVTGSEVAFSNGSAKQGHVSYRFCKDLLFGSICIDERNIEGENQGRANKNSANALLRATELAYQEIFSVLARTKHRYLFRVWNYLPEINREIEGDERYRLFNSARQLAFRSSGQATVGNVPAASVLGSPAGSPISIYFLASVQPPRMIENPRQTSAYHYPPKFGKHSPIFSRACLLTESAGTNLFISGTASIVGHDTIHADDVGAQTREIMTNINALLDEANRTMGSEYYSLDRLKLKVYVRRPADFHAIEKAITGFSKVSPFVLFLQADVCRADLLVEIEATGEPAARMA